uniref:Uncharacterized protein n=1 Tax=Astyanax mexicanus TaxID=7994 RepID=A0A3B1K1N6_ASTMX
MFHDEPPPEACSAFVSVHGQLTCSTKDMKKLLKTAAGRPKPYLYKNDHKYPGANGTDLPVVILYAEIGTKKFNTFHKVLSERAEEGNDLLLRHYVAVSTLKVLSLTYFCLAVDDTQVKGWSLDKSLNAHCLLVPRKSYPDLQGQLGDLRRHLLESTNDMAPLKVWELQDLSFQAAARIMSVPKFDSLKLMRDLSQNFPSRARSLTRVAVNQEMRKEIEENQKRLSESMGIHPGDSSLFINGIHIDLDFHNAFRYKHYLLHLSFILDIIRGEAKLLEGLHNLGIRGTSMSKFLRMPVTTVEESYALDIRHSAIMWINDIESDSTYRTWPSSLQELLRATFPGVIRQIRRNFFNLVLFLDPLFYKHKIPLR